MFVENDITQNKIREFNKDFNERFSKKFLISVLVEK